MTIQSTAIQGCQSKWEVLANNTVRPQAIMHWADTIRVVPPERRHSRRSEICGAEGQTPKLQISSRCKLLYKGRGVWCGGGLGVHYNEYRPVTTKAKERPDISHSASSLKWVHNSGQQLQVRVSLIRAYLWQKPLICDRWELWNGHASQWAHLRNSAQSTQCKDALIS